MRGPVLNTYPLHGCPNRARSRAFVRLGSAAPWDLSLARITGTTFPALYGKNWLDQLRPIPKGDVQEIIRTAADLNKSTGNDPINPLPIKSALQSRFRKYEPIAITRVLMFLKGIAENKDRFPADYKFLRTGTTGFGDLIDQTKERAAEKIQHVSYEAADKVKRGGAAVVDAAKEANDLLPFYLRPSILLPAGLAVVALIYWKQLKTVASPFLPKKKKALKYHKNPIPKAEAKEAAERIYKKFTARKPKKRFSIPKIETDELAQLGKALEIGYESDKWTGKKENYKHEFGKGVKMFCTADGKTLIITGGKMSVEDVGIVN